VSVSYSVPTALILLLQQGALERRHLDRLRLVLFAGESFPVSHLRRLMEMLPGREFVNLYGPTETNVCTYHRVASPPGADMLALPVGIPCEHLQVALLREDGSPAPIGETGEIVVSGPAVMAGYWNNPALTASVRHNGKPASYRTGDFGRMDAEGRIHLAGRRDEQVKIRGYRIELPEIAATLTSHPAVQEAAALVLDGEPARLVASIAFKPGDSAATTDLLEHCRRWLPPYALPEEIRIMHALPRTSTGKIDRQRLKLALNQTERQCVHGADPQH
jgi:acyl-coenzyme A synthetase/AMP-(fatty) acid ligase